MTEKYDLVILGSGSAAFAAAIKASESDAKTAMVERGTIGGTCVNVGCVPSKHLLTVGETYYFAETHHFEGIRLSQESFNMKKVISDKRKVVGALRRQKYVNVLKALPNVTLVEGQAQFSSKTEVKVSSSIFQAEKFIIATGSSPIIPPFQGITDVDYLTNIEALDLQNLPESLVIIGGRALALEFAQMYAHFGTKVTVLQRSPRIIPEEEPEISEMLRLYLQEEGIDIRTGVEIKALRKEGRKKIVTAKVGARVRDFVCDELLIAAGRRPNTFELALDKVGVTLGDDGTVLVNNEMHTTAPHVWAAGDVTGKPMLETTAAKEGAIASENALKGAKRKMDFYAVPHAVFTMPQVAGVGLTEAKATEKFGACSCRVLEMSLVPKARVVKDTRGVIKMVINPKTREIVGVHILSPLAADIIHEAVLAVKYHLTIDDIIDTVHVFPTMGESIKLAAQAFIRDISKISCCIE